MSEEIIKNRKERMEAELKLLYLFRNRVIEALSDDDYNDNAKLLRIQHLVNKFSESLGIYK